MPGSPSLSDFWEDLTQIFEVLPVLMSHWAGVVGGGAWQEGMWGTAPTLGKEVMLLALFTDHLSVVGDPRLATRSHFSPNMTPFVL